jgi:hypothetical protein
VTEQKSVPIYTGVTLNKEAGFGLWMPSDWHKTKLTAEHNGLLFSPDPDEINTGLLAEKRKLKYKVKVDDLPVLREAFMDGIKALPGVEIEMQDESLTKGISFFEARFTFLDGDVRRKRWIRNIYWNRANDVVIAQGKTVEDFDHWLPMFYNTMMNIQV